MQYAVYLRKSRADAEAEARGEGETLARHEKTLTELAKKMNIPITDTYREIVSGETIDARPEIRRMLAAVERGSYDGVLVMDADRLARGDSVDQGIISRTFRLSGTKIITPRKIYDPNSEFDEEYFEFELFMARREYKIINRRIQCGRTVSAKEGRYVGSVAPYGYDRVKIKNGKGYTLKPNAEADIVKYVFSRYLEDNGAGAIADRLNDFCAPTRSGKPWSRATIIGMLKNPVYTGKIRWSYRKNIKQSVNGQVVTVRRTVGDCILVDGLHEPLIGGGIFSAVQNRLAENKKKPIRNSDILKNPFTGLLYCSECGSRMTRLGSGERNKYDSVKCPNRKCGCISAPMFLAEQAVREAISEWFTEYIVRIDPQTSEPVGKAADIEKIFAELSAKSDKLSAQILKTYELLEQGIYSTEIFEQRRKVLAERENELKEKLLHLKQSIEKIRNDTEIGKNIFPQEKSVISAYDSCADAEEKNSLLKSALNRIEYVKSKPNRRGQLYNANFVIDIFPKVPM